MAFNSSVLSSPLFQLGLGMMGSAQQPGATFASSLAGGGQSLLQGQQLQNEQKRQSLQDQMYQLQMDQAKKKQDQEDAQLKSFNSIFGNAAQDGPQIPGAGMIPPEIARIMQSLGPDVGGKMLGEMALQGMKPAAANSAIGKLQSDLSNRLISPDQYKQAIQLMQPSDAGGSGGEYAQSFMTQNGPVTFYNKGPKIGQYVPYNQGSSPLLPPAQDPGLQGRVAEATATGTGKANRGLEQPDARSSANSTIAGLNKFKTTITQLIDHPGLDKITGVYNGSQYMPNLSDDSVNAQALMNNIAGNTWSQAIQELKAKAGGVGNITEQEGKKLSDSFEVLSQRQSTDTWKERAATAIQNIDSIINRVDAGYARKYGDNLPGSPVDLPPGAVEAEIARRAKARGR